MTSASHVETGSELLCDCPDCGGERVETIVYALPDIGPVPIGTLITCDGCGASFRCRFCPAVLGQDGALIHEHIAGHSRA